MGTQNHKRNNSFCSFRVLWKVSKKFFFRKLPAGGFATTKRRVLGDHNHWSRIDSQFSRIKRSPERLLDEKRGFEDQLSYPKLKFGVGKVSFRCLLKSYGLKTCSYGFVWCFAAIWHIPNHFFSIEVYQNSSKIEFGKIFEEIGQTC